MKFTIIKSSSTKSKKKENIYLIEANKIRKTLKKLSNIKNIKKIEAELKNNPSATLKVIENNCIFAIVPNKINNKFHNIIIKLFDKLNINCDCIIDTTYLDETKINIIIELFILRSFRLTKFKTLEKPNKPIDLQLRSFGKKIKYSSFKEVKQLADSVNKARRLSNTPANLLTPTMLATQIKKILSDKCYVEILNEKQMCEKKMNGVLAVGQGSSEESKVVIVKYNGTNNQTKPIVLVGKGVTFDSGGISLKRPTNMGLMKTDMTGSAVVTAIIDYISRTKLPINVIGLMGLVENMPGSGAYKPGDVITMMNGRTVEVKNTDAEGRMVLADLLYYASSFNPEYVIDYATLTGATAFITEYMAAPIFSNNDKLIEEFQIAGQEVGEEVLSIPLYQECKDLTKSEIADYKNAEYSCRAGTLMAASYLSNFVQNGTSWVHMDIASTNNKNYRCSYNINSSTCFGIRLTIKMILNQLEKSNYN